MPEQKREIPRHEVVPYLGEHAINELTRLFFREDSIITNPVDMIFVFGTAKLVQECSSCLSPLLDQKLSKKVMLTGGMPSFEDSYKGYTMSESQMLLDVITPKNWPEVKFYYEIQSTNTKENVSEALKVLDFSKYKNILFIFKTIPALRGYLTLRKFLPHTNIYQKTFPSYDNGIPITRDNWHLSSVGRSKIWGEFIRICVYGRRGDIEFDEVKEDIERIEKMI